MKKPKTRNVKRVGGSLERTVGLRHRAISAKERYEMTLENVCRPYLKNPLVRIFEPLPLPRSLEAELYQLRCDAEAHRTEYLNALAAQHNEKLCREAGQKDDEQR